MKKQSLSKNFFFQFAYQGLVLIIPLILSPYLTRTLGELEIGNYTFVNSIAYYFIVFANLGIARHGQRIISQSNDEKILRKEFWSLFSIHSIISFFIIIFYVLFVAFFIDNKSLYWIEIMYVVSALFDITWLFYGLENFKSVVIRNGIIKLLECILIFSFVHKPSDVGIYTAICSGGTLLGHVALMPIVFKEVKPIRFSKTDVIKHIKPLVVFSVAVIASTLYTVLDKTLLGILSTKENVAFYEYSNRIIIVPRSIVSVVGTVMFPRACKMAANKDFDGQQRYIHYSLLITAFIGIGAFFGLLGVSGPFVNAYYGESFSICGGIVIALSPLVLIIGMGDIIRSQYMIPNRMENQLNICIVISSMINIILSCICIPLIGVYGAVIGTISAEFFGLIYQVVICRKSINCKDFIISLIPFLLSGVSMYFTIVFIKKTLGITNIIVEIAIGFATYCLCSFLYLFVFEKSIIRALRTKIMNKAE